MIQTVHYCEWQIYRGTTNKVIYGLSKGSYKQVLVGSKANKHVANAELNITFPFTESIVMTQFVHLYKCDI